MDEIPIEKNKKRNHDSAFGSRDSSEFHIGSDGKEPLTSNNCGDNPIHIIRSLKKPKYAPPRPLRILKPTSVSGYTPTTSTATINAKESIQMHVTSPNFQKEAIRHQPKKTPFTGLATRSPNKDESSWNCIYCNKSIEGGESGKRRHQAGQKHLFQVQKSISKYVAPAILPLLQISFPARLPFNSQSHAISSFINSQIQEYRRAVSFLADAPSGAAHSPEFSSIRDTTLDIDFLITIMIIKPKNVANDFSAPGQVYTNLCHLKNRLPLLMAPSSCIFCARTNAFMETGNSSDLSFSASPVLDSSPIDWNEDQLLDFWRHLASDAHKKAVSKLWREHHIRAPVASHGDTSPDVQQDHAAHIKLRTPLHLQPASHFESASYILTQAQLQKKLEHWSRVKHLISLIPAKSTPLQEEASQLEVLPLTQYDLPASSNDSYNQQLGIKDKIKRLIVPGVAKKGERVGSKWADAVKAFMALNNLTTLQLLQLSRLERMANPNKQRTKWLPNFGGVWNETTRAAHARAFVSQSKK